MLVMAEWSVEHWWNDTDRGKPKFHAETSPSAILSNTCTGLNRERLAATRLEQFHGQLSNAMTSI
jgi:hypothetical protein